MSFTAPGTMPPQMKRQPFDMASMPPEIQQRLMAGETVPFDDGVVLYPDGTYDPGQTPGYVGGELGALGQGFDYGAGGFNDSAMLNGPEALAAPSTNPLDDPMFKRFRQTTNAGFPGSPGGIGGRAEGTDAINPMGDPVGDAADAEPSRLLTVEGPRVGAFDAGEQSDARTAPGTMPGRLGRRRMSGAPSRTSSRPMGGRRRR